MQNLIHFYGNHAQLGSVMNMSYFDLCSYYKSGTNSFSDVFMISSLPGLYLSLGEFMVKSV